MPILRRGWPFPGELSRKRPGPTVGLRLLSGGVSLNKTSSTTLLPVRLQWAAERHEGTALLDSGAEGNLLDISLAQLLHIPLVPPSQDLCQRPQWTVTSPDQSLHGTHHPRHLRQPLRDHHVPRHPLTPGPVVLGHPWLTQHNPRVDWGRNTVLEWSRACYASCLVSAGFSVCDSVLQEEMGNLSNVPEEYLDLKEVFSKSRAASLPPHRPYDCAIDLVPGMSPPKGRLYSLSVPEREAMEKYISDSLTAGFIRPSSSPAGQDFFLSRRRMVLCDLVLTTGLEQHHGKEYLSFAVMSSAFERLQGASIFTKLDLRNAYHLVRIREGDEWKTAFNTPRGHFEYLVMPFGLSNSPAVFQALVNDVLRDMVDQFIYVYLDDILIFSSSLQEHVQHVRRVLQRLLENGLFVKAEKCAFHAQSVPFLGFIVSPEGVRMDPDRVKAVVDWPTPDSRKALLRFLGFANFYRRFYSQFQPTSRSSDRLDLHQDDVQVVKCSRGRIYQTQRPLRFGTHSPGPDPTRQFVVEVDASEVGVGAVLSQRATSDDKVHPCAFFSHRLSPAERNYDIGNRELLAVKLALEEWRHWLEGSGVPFIVWTDHKNLEYIQSAKTS